MAKEPKTNWNSFTRNQLIRTIKKLDARQTKLMNMITDRDRELEQLRSAVTGGVLRDEEFERIARSTTVEYGAGKING